MVTISATELEELRKLKENKNNSKSDDQGIVSTSTDNVANFTHSDAGMKKQALLSIKKSNSSWVLDSGASRHDTGMSSEFTSYTPYSLS